MAYGYWKSGRGEQEVVFNLFFRRNPFKGGYAIACGLEYILDYLQNFRLDSSDISYLASLKGNDGKVLFEADFLDYLSNLKFSCTVDAIPEGTVVFPHEPLLRVRGPIIQCQLIETPLLNIINFQTLIATKASRVVWASKGESVLEFGLRRAQGIDGGLAASRAAYIGGCDATSNVLAGKLFGIPVRGTHAHSWVMSFESELEAFETYAEIMPNNCVFLVDTYDTIEGVKNAVKVGQKLREKGYKLAGIRLDSGDLAYLSIQARKILDEAGFSDTVIVASNDLDEEIIESLKNQEAQISVWGVGTKLVTAYDQPALGGVYKISAIRRKDGSWDYKMKLSEQSIKISNPGIQQVKRFEKNGEFIGDMIFNEENFTESHSYTMIDPADSTRFKTFSDEKNENLLVRVFENGKITFQNPNIQQIRNRVKEQLSKFHAGIKRFVNPHSYPVGLEENLWSLKHELVRRLRKKM
ncbi:nicotinate phosphoribosyltransferase [Raineya orbicola]|uniref:Nicotinate phosphoribosyltransferase n=1 Tax=Raineya orbicola TaxID=2016530 RepID=A0A2N3IB80_9BACT|nr:Nicotinate phosphoribosyltransferase [Raineya orbicola]